MTQYDILAKFYDDVIGRTGKSDKFVLNFIKRYNKSTESVLELGCGTGTNLAALSDTYRVTGIDMSDEMLKLAREKVPDAELIKADIKDFSFDRKFDCIICLYDTVNHLTEFSQWAALFENVSNHLSESGLFIFDVNTLEKLHHMSSTGSFVHRFGKNYLIMDVTKINGNVYSWDAKIFECTDEGSYSLHREVIPEAGFETGKIERELEKNFDVLDIVNEFEESKSKDSFRLYFVCRKLNK